MEDTTQSGAAGGSSVITRSVFDCNVFLQAIASNRGPAAACWDIARAGAIELWSSDDIEIELRDVLYRGPLRSKFPGLTDEAADAFMEELGRIARRIDSISPATTVVRDPKDQKYIDLAAAAVCHCLVTRDRDLLSLMDSDDFHSQYPFLSVVDPVQFIRLIAAIPAPEARIPQPL